MSNHRKTPLDFCRAKTWARVCSDGMGVRSPIALERLLQELDASAGLRAVSGAWRGYLNGTSVPYNGTGPVPESKWALLAKRACPESWPWFATPFWYLVQDREFTPSQILECVCGLPEHFREDLLYEPLVPVPAAMRLKDVPFHWIYRFTTPVKPWALGATACALRRAELAGDAATMRWCGVALVWLLDEHTKTMDPWVAEPLLEVRRLLLARFKRMVYLDGLVAAIGQPDLDHFASERSRFLSWSEEDPTDEGWRPWPLGDHARLTPTSTHAEDGPDAVT